MIAQAPASQPSLTDLKRPPALHRLPQSDRMRAIEAAGEVGERTLLLGPLAVVLENQVSRAAPNEPEAQPDARIMRCVKRRYDM